MIQSDTVTLSQRNIASTAKNHSFPVSSHCATRVIKVKSYISGVRQWLLILEMLLLLGFSSIVFGVFQK